jgi:hypothetical protein
VLYVVAWLVMLAWAIPVGGGTTIEPQAKAGEALPDLTAAQLERFLIGRERYGQPLLESEGLGPVFNKQDCANCHGNPFGGPGNQTVTRFGATGKKGGFFGLEQFGGSLLQAESIDILCEEVIPAEATVTSLRVTNGAMGYGLIEAILDADLQAIADNPPGGVSGRTHIVQSFEDPLVDRVGRFGWKAQVATLLTFSADAAQNEMGLTNRFLPMENDPNGIRPPALIDCDFVADPEDGPDAEGFDFIDRVTDFQRFMAAPPQTPKSGMTGETIFNAVGCNNCHTTSFTTSNDPGLEDVLRNKTIQPYSDFLLHDMGAAADFIAQGDAGERELRTPVLWGLRTRDPLWHDGRFGLGTFESRVTLAIEEHGAFLSEGQPSAQAFAALSPSDKSLLIAFLDSLGHIEFDADGDNVVEMNDFLDFVACAGATVYTPDDACAVHDIDQDGLVGMVDFDSFLLAYEGHRADCNCNGILDIIEIFDGSEPDLDNDGILDSCAGGCVADLNCDGDVGVPDLLAMLANWGVCTGGPDPCASDLNGDQTVGVSDLLLLLGLWAACP